MEKRNLPIGIQHFNVLRENNYLYVDKTEQIFQLAARGGGAYFLSRPRRFGKSLLISTLKELFKGHQDLFKGLWIEDKWNWTKTYPVIHFSFDKMGYKVEGLEQSILYELQKLAEIYNITYSKNNYIAQFEELITKVASKHGKEIGRAHV